MQHRERVPEHHILVDDRTVVSAPHLDALSLAHQVDPFTGRVHLAWIEERHPQRMFEERRTAARRRARSLE